MSHTRTTAAVLIVTYNSEDHVEAAIRSALTSVPGASVLVWDNHSTDRTCDVVAKMQDTGKVSLHRSSENIGFGAAVNRLAVRASADRLIVLNPDATLQKSCAPAPDPQRTGSASGIEGIIDTDSRARRAPFTSSGWRADLLWMMLRWFVLPRELEMPRKLPAGRRGHPWVSGAAFVVNRDEFIAVGGFDERLFLYFEDQELCRRYDSSGLQVAVSHQYEIRHAGQASSSSLSSLAMARAYALMSQCEMVACHEGHSAAVKLVDYSLRLLRLLRAATRVAVMPAEFRARARRKRSAIDETIVALRRIADEPPGAAYPEASGLFARSLR